MFDSLTNVVMWGETYAGADRVTRLGTVGSFVNIGVNLVLGTSFAISMGCLAYSMVLHTLSAGNPKATKKAWDAFIWAVIAGCVSIATIVFKNSVARSVGIEDTNIINGPNF